MKPVLRVSWYRFRSTFRDRWPGYLTVALLVGLLGGLSMGAIAGGRRTQSSFPKFLKSTHPSDLLVVHNDSARDDNSGDAAFLRRLASLPHVRRVRSANSPSQQVLARDGSPARDAAHQRFGASVQMTADVSGELFRQDRPTVLEGRLADPKRADEMVMSAGAARVLGLHVGDVVSFGFFTNAQTLLPTYGTGKQTPVRRIGIKLVGIVAFRYEIVRDDVDSTLKLGLFSPALTRPLDHCCANGPIAGLQLDHGPRDDAAVEAEIKALPNTAVIQITAVQEGTAERALEPQSIALGVFGAIAALATLLIAGQAIGRQLRRGSGDLDAMRALGAGPSMTLVDGMIGVIGAVFVGAVLAAAVAVALSPLSPLGPVRPVYPGRGVAFDWTVIGAGVAALIVLLTTLALALAYRDEPHRVVKRARRLVPRRSRLARAAAASGLPVSGVAGVRLALDPGHETRAVPLRSAMLGAALAITVVVATVVFGTSLNTLVSHPALYGWNWDYEMLGNYGGLADVPLPQTGKLLDQDPNVAGWSRASFGDLRIDGRNVAVLGTTPNAVVGPPVLTGHALAAPDQVVLGASTLAQLHKHLGDSVLLDHGTAKPAKLVIVGTATLPAIGAIESLHLEIGSGAVISEDLIPAADRGFGDLPDSPEAILVRLRSGANLATARRSVLRIAREANVLGHGPPSVVAVQRPAEIVNYRTMGNTPALLGAALAGGAVVGLGLTLFASVRRRRRDLALLKTLGFTQRQLAATVAWQASIAVALGVFVGVPLGIVAGRELWDRFAAALHVVPQTTVSAPTIALIAAGALLVANLVAAIPGRQAARTETAVLLRAE
ncbi:MAG TPA: ABC transporter permease [Acidimicrobiia bacterium]|nr:ABC transporter permease [Acidimicrobiia bacterium]